MLSFVYIAALRVGARNEFYWGSRFIDKLTYHRILAPVIICSASDSVQLHKVFKVANLSVHPSL